MKPEEVIRNVRSFRWKPWLNRPFDSFMLSLFQGGIAPQARERTALPAVECPAIVFDGYGNQWCESTEIWDAMAAQIAAAMKGKPMAEVAAAFDHFYQREKGQLRQLAQEESDAMGQLREVYSILSTSTAYIWLTHGLEHYYTKLLDERLSKHSIENREDFVAAAGFPKKKVAHARMEDAIRNGGDAEKIAEEFGWLRIRDGFSEPFTVKDILEMRRNSKLPQEHAPVEIPEPLRGLFADIRELVYFRTHRTDVFYELLFLARPALQRAARRCGMEFAELCYYPIQGILEGKPERREGPFTFLCYRGEGVFLREQMFNSSEKSEMGLIRGVTAHRGIVRGPVKVVCHVSELPKVAPGDVLVAPMTFPSFIVAMQKAAAFVTDEGGMTCHAAIVAREMGKPCVVGTGCATKVLKDGDVVEVDAEKGVVRRVKS